MIRRLAGDNPNQEFGYRKFHKLAA
jgi:hypothetical protein